MRIKLNVDHACRPTGNVPVLVDLSSGTCTRLPLKLCCYDVRITYT